MRRVVVVHALRDDSRLTTVQHALFLARYGSGVDLEIRNVFGPWPRGEFSRTTDVVVVTYDVMALRTLPLWRFVEARLGALMRSALHRVVFTQDDYTMCAVLDRFLVRHDVHAVYTPLQGAASCLYPRSTRNGIRFEEALTGYLDSDDVDRLRGLRIEFDARPWDVGQRVRLLPLTLGAAARQKAELALAFGAAAQDRGFTTNVSCDSRDFLSGEDWWSFLGGIRFTVGANGGAAIADPHGTVSRWSTARAALIPNRPRDSYDLALARRFGRAGDYRAISPRLFESAAMGVCQILAPDNYLGRLQPWRDYLPLNPDLSNIERVFECMRDTARCMGVAEAAYEALAGDGRLTYRGFTNEFTDRELGPTSSDAPLMVVTDPAAGFDAISASAPDGNRWVRDYTRRVLLSGRLAEALQAATRGRLLGLSDLDRLWQDNLEGNTDSVALWLNGIFTGELTVESLVWPWRSNPLTPRDGGTRDPSSLTPRVAPAGTDRHSA